MKNLFFAFLLLFCYSLTFGQKDAEKEILKLEVSAHREYYAKNTRATVNDSIIVNIEVNQYIKTLEDLRLDVVNTEGLSDKEVNEIFGKKQENLFNTTNLTQRKWSHDFFPGLKVKLYDHEKMEKIYFPYLILSLSQPIFRKDNKYALIISSNENDGGVLSIYKNTKNGWIIYKKLLLFFI